MASAGGVVEELGAEPTQDLQQPFLFVAGLTPEQVRGSPRS